MSRQRRVALVVEYDGTAFHGWQTQPAGGTVQQALEAAAASVADEPVATICAGRTDAGVHALYQVVHFDTAARRSADGWRRGCNAGLPATVRVQWAGEVAPEFHARFGAVSRRYTYLVLNRPGESALLNGRCAWERLPLAVDAMRDAASALIGRHDFTSFRSAHCQAPNAVRELRELAINRQGDFVRFDIEANAFLHNMVRILVGSLLRVGRGDARPAWLQDALAARDRCSAGKTAPPGGLYLAGVDYPPGAGLPPAPDRAGIIGLATGCCAAPADI